MMKIIFNVIVCNVLIAESLIISGHPTTDNDNDCDCGLEVIKPRITNGLKVRGHKYPWMVQIKSYPDRDEDEYFQCGGSLVDNQTIITAAHCFENDDGGYIHPKNIDIYMGQNTVGDQGATYSIYKVSSLWTDPKYNSTSLSNDFAILQLAAPIKFDRKISPICLPTTTDGLENFTITGWGRTGSSKNSSTSDSLLETTVNLVPRNGCNQLLLDWLNKTNSDDLKSPDFNISTAISETHLCASNYETGGDACTGDSGGPLMYLGKNGRWFLVGVVSGSWSDCGTDKESASLYTSMSYYQKVIKSQVQSGCWFSP